jgi:hypothetical protein
MCCMVQFHQDWKSFVSFIIVISLYLITEHISFDERNLPKQSISY